MWKCTLVFCSILVLVQGQDDDWLQVNITQGPVRGRKDPDGGLYVFYNVPYATAPTGRDRFKPPLPPPVWMSPLDAVNRNIRCPQPNVLEHTQEDCLVVNLFVPDTTDTNLPVLVFIHGGAFQNGHGLSGQYRELVRTNKLIAVSFNYRIGVHGFLCLGTEGAPGNAGIKDQVALLHWVNTNIARFGGNPQDVTLAACSAGSGALDVLTLSSATTGLFQKAILESGSSTGAVGVIIDPIQNAKNYAKVLNFDNVDDLESLEEFYRTAPFELLTSRVDEIVDNKDTAVRFAPCVERDIGQERVITDAPMNVIKRGNYTKVPLLYGFTNMEGAMRLPYFDTWKDQMNEKFSDFLPAELHFDDDQVKEQVAQKVKQFYFGDSDVGEDTMVSFLLYFTDVLFAYPMLKSLSARVEALGDTIYLFEYSFVDEDTPSFPHTNVRGAQHCFQSRAVRDQDLTGRTDAYRRMVQIAREYTLNFILTGSPTSSDARFPLWRPANAQRSPHMSIGPVIELRDDILGDRAAFWDSIYEEHYRGPLVPDSYTGANVRADGSRVVNITQGPVRGRLLPGGGVYGFYNIPYASAPTGADRYKAPRPPPTWLTTFEAEDRKIMCPQRFTSETMNIQEDCLVVNVFIPDTEETNLPVHVYIHGGAYQFGFGLQGQFTELVKRKIISVSFNYRLGVHGFLCLGTEAAPGNAGLKDMVALLRWVNTNIASFGGNPDDVTLSACSAGSGSLDFLTVSSLTNGLFKKVIQESGTVIGAVAAQVDPIQNARNYAAVLNFDNINDLNSLEEFYKSVSIQQLVSRSDAIVNNEGVTSRFGPCVERDVGQEIFLSDAPMNILSHGNYTNVPRMYGFTNMDGSVRFSVFDTWKEMMNEKFSDFLPSELHFDSEEVKEQVAERVKQFYFGDSPVGDHNFLSYIYYNTDVLFSYPMLKTLSTRVEALGDSIYLFEYTFVDENSPGFPQTEEIGARHCAQEMIVSDGDVTTATDEFKRMQEIMRNYWMSFISNGYPSSSDPSLPTWRPANAQRSPHMSLGRDIVLKESSPIPERAAFWDEIFEEHFRGPIVDTDPVAPTPTPTPGAASSLVISSTIFVVLLFSFYFTLNFD
ncbi:hypothetical protein HF086_001401 [Spodoptera exigua]|uniref:Carboxylesterase type B domain-containing protein n=1 Tax=Spodoptera exigua TaxID=7107 RepID=A0A922MCM5_SPOEX|nr:hypothetical protein HF086_001401 [Spodoptera exigua]